MTEPTRYLCAAVQVNEEFCNDVIKEFLENKYTAIGVCHGVDIPTVLKSCLMAKKRRDKQDNRLLILWLVSCIILFLAFFNHLFIFLLIFIFVFEWRARFLNLIKIRYGIIGKYLLKENFNPDFFNSDTKQELEYEINKINETQEANVIIYNGFSPFVGSGVSINKWSFAVDLSKGKENMGDILKPISFQISELYSYIDNLIINLKVPGLIIENNLYVNGGEIRNNKNILPNILMRPITKVEDSFLNYFVENNDHSIRYYKCIRVIDWKGELILSIFLRFSKIGSNLFIEAHHKLLLPLIDYYRQFDKFKSVPSFKDIINLIIDAFFSSLITLIMLITIILFPLYIFYKLIYVFEKDQKLGEKEKDIKSNSQFNYGVAASLRERISQNQYQRYFQQLDQEMYLKVIERRIIDGLLKFLDSKNIDTSDFKETKSTILNHGVMVSGGSIEAQNLTVGNEAKSIFSNIDTGIN